MNPLVELVRREIAARGPVPFARFMELALYCPDLGYYERAAETVGRRGDFYTNVSVGGLFGELLACQFAEWLSPSRGEDPSPAGDTVAPTPAGGPPRPPRHPAGRKPEVAAGPGPVRGVPSTPATCWAPAGGPALCPSGDRTSRIPAASADRFQLLEAGGHDGQLAKDILTWLRQWRPALCSRVEYWLLEPSARARARQRVTLAGLERQVRWFDSWEALPPAGVTGVIFANELLDGLPVHRLRWDAAARQWHEWGVDATPEGFVWVRLPESSAQADALLKCSEFHRLLAADDRRLEAVLPPGFTIEVCPAATAWWRRAATVLRQGVLLTFDYGLETEDFLRPERAGGTLRAYAKHRVRDDLLADVGEQDLTAHVNFSALRAAGESAGLKTQAFTSQARFLAGIAATLWDQRGWFADGASDRLRQFQTLIHPEHLGRAFRVLVQSR